MLENKKKIQRTLRFVLLAIVSVIFGFGVYRWNAQSLTGNVMPMPFGMGIGVVMSGSMEPELSVDDVIFVVERDTYEVGDVVVFQQKNVLVVHKIIEKNGEEVVTQGTANNVPDPPMKISLIKGEVVFHIDKIGGVVTWLKSPMGTIVILGVAVALLLYSYSLEKEEKDEKDERLEQIKREIAALKGNGEPSSDCHCEQSEEIPRNEV